MTVDWTDLPEFDTVKSCAACGAHTVCGFSIEFVQSGEVSGDDVKDLSFMKRTCPRCGYEWREKPLYLCEDKRLGPSG